MQKARALLETLRPHQWVKNLFVGAALLFSKNLFETALLWRAALACLIYCLLSGAVYIINDLSDVEGDRVHPRKANRPIASGRLPLPTARHAAGAVTIASLGAALLLDRAFAATALAYFLLNLCYSLWLKRIAFLDVLTIAAGFLLRVIGGAYAIDVYYSGWLLLCTGLLACFLGFGKRAHELASSGERAGAQRAVLTQYRAHHLRQVLRLLLVLTTFAYLMYTLSPHTREFFATRHMIWTVPFIVVGMTRFLHLVASRPRAESPTQEMLRDPLFLANLVLWVGAVVFVIYFESGGL